VTDDQQKMVIKDVSTFNAQFVEKRDEKGRKKRKNH